MRETDEEAHFSTTFSVPEFLAHISRRKQAIQESDISFESTKCPLKSGFSNLLKH
jgi:hypothetical protein